MIQNQYTKLHIKENESTQVIGTAKFNIIQR